MQQQAVAKLLLKRGVVTRSELQALLAKNDERHLDANRLLVDIVAHKSFQYQRMFVDIIQEKQCHIWFFSQLYPIGARRKSSPKILNAVCPLSLLFLFSYSQTFLLNFFVVYKLLHFGDY